jgi:hypothetical protein
MAKRKSVRRVPSVEIQGEDSWVDLRAVLYKEVTKALQEDPNVPEAKRTMRREEQVRSLIADSIAGWNWVDDDDKPLSIPQDATAVGEVLYTHEVTWLTEAVLGSLAESKN